MEFLVVACVYKIWKSLKVSVMIIISDDIDDDHDDVMMITMMMMIMMISFQAWLVWDML